MLVVFWLCSSLTWLSRSFTPFSTCTHVQFKLHYTTLLAHPFAGQKLIHLLFLIADFQNDKITLNTWRLLKHIYSSVPFGSLIATVVTFSSLQSLSLSLLNPLIIIAQAFNCHRPIVWSTCCIIIIIINSTWTLYTLCFSSIQFKTHHPFLKVTATVTTTTITTTTTAATSSTGCRCIPCQPDSPCPEDAKTK